MEEPFVLHFAGLCKGSSPGPGSSGFVLSRGDSSTVIASGHALSSEETTKSVAEYHGLLMGLSTALHLGIRHILAKGNSEVVVYTVRGVLRVRQQHLAPHCRRARFLAARFDSFAIERTSDNGRAVAEANKGFDRELRDVNVIVARGGYDPLPWTERGSGRPARWKSDSIEIVNPYTGARRMLPSMPKFKNPECPDYDENFGDLEVGAATFGDRVYFVGGECVSRSYPGGVRSIDVRTGKWRRHSSLPEQVKNSAFRKRTGCAVSAVAGKIWQIGGKYVDDGDAHACHDTDIYDPAKDVWTVGPKTSAPRMHASAVSCDGFLVVCGGTGSVIVDIDGFENYGPSQQTAVDQVEVLDVYRRPLAWMTASPLPEKLAGVVLLAYDGAVFAVGGQAIVYDSPAKGAKCTTTYVRSVYALDMSPSSAFESSTGGPGVTSVYSNQWDTLQRLPVATAYGTVFDLGSGYFCIAASGHADLLLRFERVPQTTNNNSTPTQSNGRRPFRCQVLREGWPCDTQRPALSERSASGVCLGAERASQASLALVDPASLSGPSRLLV